MSRNEMERIARMHPAYRWTYNTDPPPWTPLRKPPGEWRVALISSGGVYPRTDPPFDVTTRATVDIREIPKNTRTEDVHVIHKGYNTADAEQDLNCIFPLERFTELEAEGAIQALVDPGFSFMGRVFSRKAIIESAAPALARRLHELRVDLLYLVPA